MKKLLFVALVSIAGCTPVPFIVVEQTAPSPSFTVIPYDGDSNFSRRVEREILGLNFKVVERPELKYLPTDAHKTEGSGMSYGSNYGRAALNESVAESVTAPFYKVDIIAMYPEAKSDYIVVVYSGSEEIRILKKADLSLVASGAYSNTINMTVFIRSVLGNANLLTGKFVRKECKKVSQPDIEKTLGF